MPFLILFAVTSTFWNLVRRFGAFMFFPLAFLDNSVIPVPGSMDALLIVLAGAHKELFWYYALMATAASVVGAWPTYKIGEKSGEEALNKRLGEKRAQKVCRTFEKYGFWSIFVGAIAPPPVPTAAFIGTAGAMRYSMQKVAAALAMGRVARYMLIAWIASRYGQHIFGFLTKYYKPALWTLVVLGIAGGTFALIKYRKARNQKKAEDSGAQVPQRNAA